MTGDFAAPCPVFLTSIEFAAVSLNKPIFLRAILVSEFRLVNRPLSVEVVHDDRPLGLSNWVIQDDLNRFFCGAYYIFGEPPASNQTQCLRKTTPR